MGQAIQRFNDSTIQRFNDSTSKMREVVDHLMKNIEFSGSGVGFWSLAQSSLKRRFVPDCQKAHFCFLAMTKRLRTLGFSFDGRHLTQFGGTGAFPRFCNLFPVEPRDEFAFPLTHRDKTELPSAIADGVNSRQSRKNRFCKCFLFEDPDIQPILQLCRRLHAFLRFNASTFQR